jgi:hypothetical protein
MTHATQVRKYVNGKSLGKTAINDPGKNLFEHTFVRNLNQSLTQMKTHFKRCSCEVWRDNQGSQVTMAGI